MFFIHTHTHSKAGGRKKLGNEGCVCYLHCADGFMTVHIAANSSNGVYQEGVFSKGRKNIEGFFYNPSIYFEYALEE